MKKITCKIKLLLIITPVLILCLFLLGCHLYTNWQDPAPRQDADGYYLLRSKEDFKWFISTVTEGNTKTNVRLMSDLLLNDTSDWEQWDNTMPENSYIPIVHYNGHFDGNGHALEGYHSKYNNWQASIFTTLEEDAQVTDLTIRNSFFRTTYEDSSYTNYDDKTNVATASVLCHTNYGTIKGCHVHARVLGAWSAGGIVSINYGQISDCHFSGSVEAGLDQNTEMPDNGISFSTLFAGGICSTNTNTITDCTNAGSITLHSLPDAYPVYDYAAGGIAGRSSEDGIIETSENTGDIECVQLAGGIAGASWGKINQCTNNGHVHVNQADWDYTTTLIGAGICASNGGIIDTCLNTGPVTIRQDLLSFYAPIYGIANNTVNPSDGITTNCYYLAENTVQDYRQSGVYKLSSEDETDFPAYLSGAKQIHDMDSWDLLPPLPDYPGTDQDDYIHLGFGPAKDVNYEIKPGDTLWQIAEQFYGDGRFYDLLEPGADSQENGRLIPGGYLTVPRKDFYLLCANDEEGFTGSYCLLPSGESCPTRFVAAKPIDWYYGNMIFAANAGLDTMWPKDKEQGQDAAAADIRIFYRVDGNPEGDFFAKDWPGVQESIRKSAKAYCGDAIDSLRFYCYTLDSGENLYGYSFRLHKENASLKCAVFYRIRDGLIAEFIGVDPVWEEEHVLERVRYLAARVDSVIAFDEVQSDPGSFYGRENWEFPQLHNPFATALEYDKDAECNSYMLFTGAQ